MQTIKLQWLSFPERKRFIMAWAKASRHGFAFLVAPSSNVDHRPRHWPIVMAPDEVRAEFVTRWLDSGAMSMLLWLYPMTERLPWAEIKK